MVLLVWEGGRVMEEFGMETTLIIAVLLTIAVVVGMCIMLVIVFRLHLIVVEICTSSRKLY